VPRAGKLLMSKDRLLAYEIEGLNRFIGLGLSLSDLAIFSLRNLWKMGQSLHEAGWEPLQFMQCGLFWQTTD